MTARRVIYNDDSQGVHEARPGSAEADLRTWVDKPLSQIPVDTYAWCIAYPDIVYHDSKVGEVFGQRFSDSPAQTATAIRELRQAGTDVMHVVADQAHRHGVEIVASMRMNDTHHYQPDPKNPSVSQFLIDHPEYRIRRQDGIPETALDYSHAEVRDHRLGILRELAANYDVDGVELDFMRWSKFFARHEAPFKIDIMTEFVGRVRQVLDAAAAKRGRGRLTLGVTVAGSLYLNHLAGLDPRTWVENGWIDYLIQCDFNCTDPQIPVTEFAEFCKDSPCTHHVRMGCKMGGRWNSKPHMTERKTRFVNLKGYGGMILTVEEARGAAANIYGLGADGVGLWNVCCNMGQRHKPGKILCNIPREEYQKDMIVWANEVADPDRVWSGQRVYHYLPIYKSENPIVRNYPVNTLHEGPTGEKIQVVSFVPNNLGFRVVYRFLMADGRDGGKLRGTLRFRILQSTIEDQFEFDVNGQGIAPADICAEPTDDDELPYVWYEVDLAKCPPLAGNNELGMTMTKLAIRRTDQDPLSPYEPFPYMEEMIVTVEVQ